MKRQRLGRTLLTVAAALAIMIGVSGCILVPVPFPVWGGGGEHYHGGHEH